MQCIALSWLLHSGEILGDVRFICGGRQDSVGESSLVELLEHTKQKVNLTMAEYTATELGSGRQDGYSIAVCVLVSLTHACSPAWCAFQFRTLMFF